MTRLPGERTAIESKQATARLPHREYNINCNLSKPAQAFYHNSVPALHVYSQISHAKQKPCAYLKMEFIMPYNFSGGHRPIRNKTPKYQE